MKHEAEEDLMVMAEVPEEEGEEKPRKRGRPKASGGDTSPVPKLLIASSSSSSGRGHEDAQEQGLGGGKRGKRSREEREGGEEGEEVLSILLPAGKAQVSEYWVYPYHRLTLSLGRFRSPHPISTTY